MNVIGQSCAAFQDRSTIYECLASGRRQVRVQISLGESSQSHILSDCRRGSYKQRKSDVQETVWEHANWQFYIQHLCQLYFLMFRTELNRTVSQQSAPLYFITNHLACWSTSLKVMQTYSRHQNYSHMTVCPSGPCQKFILTHVKGPLNCSPKQDWL